MEATSTDTPLSSFTDLPEDEGNFTTEFPIYFGENVFFFQTPEDMLNPAKRNPAFYPIVITHFLTFVVGIIGNIVAVSVMLGDRKGRSATNLFLVSLSVADLLLLLLCIPLEVLLYFLQFEDNGVICKTARYTELLSASASVLNLCAVSLERFIVIVFPMRSRSVCTMSNCRKAVCFVWAVAMVLSLPVVLTNEGYSVTYTNNITSVSVYYCEEKSVSEGLPIAIYKFVILFAAPALLMMICYVYVIRELWRSTQTMNILTNSKSAATALSNRKSNEKKEFSSIASRVKMEKVNGIQGQSEKQKRDEPRQQQNQQPLQLQVNLIQSSPHERSPSICSLRSNGDSTFIPEEYHPGIHGERHQNNGNPLGSVGRELNVKHLQNNGRAGGVKKPKHTTNQVKPHRGEDPKKTRKQVIKMLILIIILFLIGWGPKLILNITLKLALIFGLPIYSPEVYYCRVIFSLVPFVHSCINPIVYSFMSSQFRNKMSRQLRSCWTSYCKCECVYTRKGKSYNSPPSRNALPSRGAPRTRTTSLAIETSFNTRKEEKQASITTTAEIEMNSLAYTLSEEASAI